LSQLQRQFSSFFGHSLCFESLLVPSSLPGNIDDFDVGGFDLDVDVNDNFLGLVSQVLLVEGLSFGSSGLLHGGDSNLSCFLGVHEALGDTDVGGFDVLGHLNTLAGPPVPVALGLDLRLGDLHDAEGLRPLLVHALLCQVESLPGEDTGAGELLDDGREGANLGIHLPLGLEDFRGVSASLESLRRPGASALLGPHLAIRGLAQDDVDGLHAAEVIFALPLPLGLGRCLSKLVGSHGSGFLGQAVLFLNLTGNFARSCLDLLFRSKHQESVVLGESSRGLGNECIHLGLGGVDGIAGFIALPLSLLGLLCVHVLVGLFI